MQQKSFETRLKLKSKKFKVAFADKITFAFLLRRSFVVFLTFINNPITKDLCPGVKLHIKLKIGLSLNFISNLEEVEEIGQNLHDSEHADTGGDSCDAAVHVVVGDHLLLLDNDEPFQEVVSLVHLIS